MPYSPTKPNSDGSNLSINTTGARGGTRTALGRCRPTTTVTRAPSWASAAGHHPHDRRAASRSHRRAAQEHSVAEGHRLGTAGRAGGELDDRLPRRSLAHEQASATTLTAGGSITAARPVDTIKRARSASGARVERDERATDAPRRKPHGDRTRRVEREHTDDLAVETARAARVARSSAAPGNSARVVAAPFE